MAMLSVWASTSLSRAVGPEELLIQLGQAEQHGEIPDQSPAEVTGKMSGRFQLIAPGKKPEERRCGSPL